ncbi:hypothetical protein [Rhizobium sp. WYCCWR 11128]|uniref:hypothetical protein n=1 Tax=Rhizobium sp. WYCCWR 11128 TaxID=2749832 RepID=UPI0015D2E03E|nr:hypothetical protein [Rhizobium sp. WYCCWR 11128]NYT33901.1 hypothetical protein [Rhizobium sp. WYCCWR 11128]
MKDKEHKDQRIPLMAEPSLVDEIDTYRFTNRIGTRAEAVRHLIRLGLENENGDLTRLEPR